MKLRLMVATSLFLAATTLLGQTQTQPIDERVEVNLVLVDATVTDRDGNPILGLGSDDFIVTENGTPQTIESVDYFTSRRLLDQREGDAKFRVDRVREERHIIFFFDKPDDYGSASMSDIQAARQAAREFVNKQMVATDRVAIAGHDVRLKIYSDFSNDRKQLLKAIDDAVGFGKGITTGSGPILSAVDERRMMNESGRVYEALSLLADATREIRGRKTLILFSYGMGDVNPHDTQRIERGDTHYVDESIAALNRANVSVNVINLYRDPHYRPTEEYLLRYAEETNGSYQRNLVRFDAAVSRINRENAGYYLIAYRPSAATRRGFQKVEVKLRNPEFKVRARKGYVR